MIADITQKENNQVKHMQIELSHEDGYHFTAIPVVACLLQYFNERKTGLWFQAEYVEPQKFIDDLIRMGIKINICP